MLKRFTVENFASFDQEQVFDLTAGNTTKLTDHVVKFADVGLLKTAVVYGANASGKSNLIKAIDFAKQIIINKITDIDTYQKHFRLSATGPTKPSSFEFEIEIDAQFYTYGFSAHLQKKQITEEWLYQITHSNAKLIFERKHTNIKLGSRLAKKETKSRFEIYAEDMAHQPGQLFLTEIASKALTIDAANIFNQIFNWIQEKLIIIYPDDKFNGMRSINQNVITSLTNYLNKFDTGVVEIESIDEDFATGLQDIPKKIKSDIENKLLVQNVKEIILQSDGGNPQFLTIYKNAQGDLKVRKLGFIHGKDRKESFELKDESDGTRRLLDFIPLIAKFTQGFTIVIDEFDRSLHPKLTREFFKLFHDINTLNSQLIVTTHESTLLDLTLIRRDEIWFVEKNKSDSSDLFSLNKFNIRYDSKVDKAYLLGRYGAVPIFTDGTIGFANGV